MKNKGVWIKVKGIQHTPLGVLPIIEYRCSKCGSIESTQRPVCPSCERKMKMSGERTASSIWNDNYLENRRW